MKTSKIVMTLLVVMAAAMWTVGVINFMQGDVLGGLSDVLMAVSDALMAWVLWRQMKTERIVMLTAKQFVELLETLHKGVPATLTVGKDGKAVVTVDSEEEDGDTIPEEELTEDEKRIKRMAEEYDELAGRLERLTNFLASDKFKTLSAESQKLLFAQCDAMSSYEKALHKRIRLECKEANNE